MPTVTQRSALAARTKALGAARGEVLVRLVRDGRDLEGAQRRPLRWLCPGAKRKEGQTDARTSASASALHPKLDDLVQRVPVACTALRTFVWCGAGGARLPEPTRYAFSGVPGCRDASTKKSGGWDGILPNFAAASVLLRVLYVQANWGGSAVVHRRRRPLLRHLLRRRRHSSTQRPRRRPTRWGSNG